MPGNLSGSSKRTPAKKPIQEPALADVSLQTSALAGIEDETRYSELSWEEADLREARASGVVFDTCLIRRGGFDGSLLSRLRLLDVRLEKCNLTNARWENAHLRRVLLVECRLTALSFAGADCRDVVFRRCKADFLNLSGAVLKGVRFEECSLSNCDFRGAALTDVGFAGSDLKKADFGSGKLDEVDIRGSTIDGIMLEPSQLRGLTIDPLQALAIVRLLGVTVA